MSSSTCWCASRIGLLAVSLSIPLVAAEQASNGLSAECHASAQRIWEVLEAVMQKHMDPPIRQQMIQAGMRGVQMQVRANASALIDQTSAISNLGSREETERYIGQWLEEMLHDSEVTLEKLETEFIDNAIGVAPGNPNYIPPREAKVDRQVRDNRYVGIGIALSKNSPDGYPIMLTVFPRGPAARGGGRDGDLLLTIDGADTKDLRLEQVIAKLRGQAGLPVTIVVRQPMEKESRTLTITRGEVPIETLEGMSRKDQEDWSFHIAEDPSIAYVKVKSIRGSTVSEFREAARKIHAQESKAIILDLRQVASGERRHAAMIADLLLDEAKIGSAMIRGREEKFESNSENLFPGLPMAVLIGPMTSGQGEWIAASLKQRPDTFLLGDDSLGQAFVSELVPLPNGGTCELRVGVFHAPDGRPLVSAQSLFALIADQYPSPTMRHTPSKLRRRGWSGVAADIEASVPLEAAIKKLKEQVAS